MKNVLITGANSYIGTSFENYIKKYHSDELHIETVDMTSADWKKTDFSCYDTVFHVAGIAHSDSGKISAEKEKLYRSVNTDLTEQTALKAKESGVKQFIFMSSVIIYGESAPVGKTKVVTKDTAVAPANCYGDSKVQAEKRIMPLNDEIFNVVILRPPMIYGKNSRGNYPLLSKTAKKLPFFPYVKNERSMLHIDNLCELIRLLINNNEYGIFYPQNSEYVNTSDMVKMIAEANDHKILMVPCNLLIKLLGKIPGKIGSLANKAFGNLVYDMSMSEYRQNYRIRSFEESIKMTECE